MNKYPLDAQGIEEISRDMLEHDRAQRHLIESLCALIQEVVDEGGIEEDSGWFDTAQVALKEMRQRSFDFENHRFNQKNGHNVGSKSPYKGGPIDIAMEAQLNQAEAGFGEPWTEEELAKHFNEKPPQKKKKLTEKALKKMSLEEIEAWEKSQDSSNDIYKVSARIKNLARVGGAALTPAGDMLCNTFTHVVKAFYDFAETIQDKETKIKLIELVKKNEGMPATLIAALNAGVK
ncbi:MAG: hypothetical protein OIN85_00715 [Candidatus Methanoperedens sp.]|nr:hypothetical protein [Candidatus Methanoperedens sp.]